MASDTCDSLAPVTTQHGLTTQVIDVHANGTANSTTYYTASHFGMGDYAGQVLYAYGKYLDVLVKVDEQMENPYASAWRVVQRELVYMGPLIGNLSVFS